MKKSDLIYDLPAELIAQRPAPERRGSRLMRLPTGGGRPEHLAFADFPRLLGPGDVLVLNDTRVLQARVHARRRSGGAVKILFIRETGGGLAEVMIESRGRLAPGEELVAESSGIAIQLREKLGGGRWIAGAGGHGWSEVMESGRPPLPPYIKRPFEGYDGLEEDRGRYQTVFAAKDGSIAAPTAGLHFDGGILEEIARRGVRTVFVTLHVGIGTFKPIEADDLADHGMEAEKCSIAGGATREIGLALSEGRRVVAAGTTVVRCLESAAMRGGIEAGDFETSLFIRPPFEFRVVSALLTNFHLPGSTLIALVAAFAGRERIMEAYREAVAKRYRFYSYGDAMFAEVRGRGN